jgi:hypothetical protein
MLTIKRCLVWLSLILLPIPSSAYSYEVLDLAPILGPSASPMSFGNSGGLLVQRSNQYLFWSAVTGLLPIPDPAGGRVLKAVGVNSHNEVAGVFQNPPTGYPSYHTAFLWSPNGGFQFMGPTLDAVDSTMQVRAVTDSGDILVDYLAVGNYPPRAYVLHRDGTARPLVAPVGITVDHLVDLSESGDVVGVVQQHGGGATIDRAIAWDAAGNFHDLGSLGVESRPLTVNSDGTVLLTGADVFYHQHYYLQRRDGTRLFTGMPYAYDLNSAEATVGITYDNGLSRGTLWQPNTSAVPLDSLIDPASGWQIQSAEFINDSGQIVGWAKRGASSGYVLLSPVPEPSTLACFLLGAAAFAKVRRRKP